MGIHAKNASLRRHYPVQVVRVKKHKVSISANAPLANIFFNMYKYKFMEGLCQ